MVIKYWKYLLAPALIFISSIAALAQSAVNGPMSVLPNKNVTYYVDDDLSYSSPNWSLSPGSVQSQWVTQPGGGIFRYNVTVKWTQTGTGTITLYNGSTAQSSANVIINCPGAPATPSVSFSITSDLCAPRTISYTGGPPAGTTYYWQTSSSGTSTGNSSNSMNVYNGGTYYVRALNNSTGCWSTNSASQHATVYQQPATPPSPSATTNSCGAKTLTRANPPGGVTYYWQGTTYNGTSTSNSASTYVAYATGTYYIRALDASGCWSQNVGKAVTIYDPPAPPALSATSNACGVQTITANGAPGTNITWYWQYPSSSGTSTSQSSGTPYTASVSGNYHLRAYNTYYGCWGGYSSVYVTVNPAPNVPTSPMTVSSNVCGPKTVTRNDSPFPGEEWHWQGTNPNGTLINPNEGFVANATGTYYLRARKTSNGCWSGSSQGVSIIINTPPAPPTPNVTTNACGSQMMSFNGSPPDGVQWFWQGQNSDGVNSAFPQSESSAVVSGTYYLRARSDSPTFCWSETSAAVVVTVNNGPSVSNQPTVSSNTCGPKTITKATPQSGAIYYWQTVPNGEDDTSPTATASTYVVTQSGQYYIRAKSTINGCWGPTSGPYVTIDDPVAPANNSFTYCEWSTMAMTTTGIPSGGNLKWYTSGDQYLATTPTYTPTNVGLGTHVYHVKAVSSNDCLSANYATVTLTITNCDSNLNWNETSAYTIDGAGNPVKIASSRNYLDGFGKVMQVQSKSFSSNQVLATQPILDYLREPAASTLVAPINSPDFAYRYRFVTNSSNNRYSPEDFDNSVTTSNPVPVGSDGPGTLGWYYSSANTMEELTPTTSFPYSRSWSARGPDPTLSKSAGQGEAHKMGSGHEVINERQSIATGELDHYYSLRTHFVSTALPPNINVGYKYITTDPDGKKSVVFNDADGKTLAAATINGSGGYENWSYVYYNDVGQVVGSVAPNGVNTGSAADPAFKSTTTYDYLGNVIESTSADEGTSEYMYNIQGQIRFSQNQLQRDESLGRFSYTNYDYLGRLTEAGVFTPDDSNLVFGSATMEALLENTEPGGGLQDPPAIPPTVNLSMYYEEEVVASSSITLSPGFTVPAGQTFYARLDNTPAGPPTGLPGTKSEISKVYYDRKADDFIPDAEHSGQTFLYGQVSKTENENATTWYSYDEDGQLVWTKQYIDGLGEKTIDYTYDFVGNVLLVAYQKGKADAFYHHYTYDEDQRLSIVHTSPNGIDTTRRATYIYYLHGPLKRMELGTDVQGIDYVYTITGALKGINHADDALDPGGDGDDLFGMTLNYYDNDYSGAGYSAGAQTLTGYADQYSGAIKATSWHNAVDSQEKRTYAYSYDNLNQLSAAQFGNMTGAAGSYGFSGSLPLDPYKESISAYDKNGNIQGLTRRGKTGPLGNYGYVYTPNTNQLDKINDNGSLLVDYTHNAIGQMVEQTENGTTMKISYNAYGIVEAIRDISNVLQVSYHYDDGGNRVRNTYYESGNASRNDYYVHDASGNVMAIYQQPLPGGQPVLAELPIYGAGRVALYKPQVSTVFYELNDHLGNVRSVIGVPETDTYTYTATMESENMGLETQVFTNIDPNNIVPFVSANQTVGGNEVVRLNNSYRIGPSKSMKVSPGDTVNLEVYAYYEAASGYGSTSTTVAALVSAVSSAFGGVMGGLGESGLIYNGVDDAIAATGVPTNPGDTRPAAYLEYILFDASYNFVTRGWQIVPTSANFAKQKIEFPTSIVITEPGYLFAYVSYDNESTNWVFFDELKITHAHDNVVAGADFYPFGLVMEGREITDEDYRFGYQGQYAEKDSVSGWSNFQLRMYDPRFGRWLSPDPYGQYASPYVGMGNVPNMGTDPDGGFTEGTTILNEVVIKASKLPSTAQTIMTTLARGLSSAITSGFSPPHDYIRNADGSLKLERLTNDEFDRVKELDGEVTTYLRPVEVRSTMLDGGPLGQAVRNGRSNVINFPVKFTRFYYQFAGGAKDFVSTYFEMRNADWVGSDKYFHSKANFDAAMRGDGGHLAAEKMSNLRESFDMAIKGDKLEWSLQDQAANRYGRLRANQYRLHGGSVNYQDALPKYRPRNLPSKY